MEGARLCAPAGAPRYGGTLRGRLIYVHPDFKQPASCAPANCSYACQDLTVRPPARRGPA